MHAAEVRLNDSVTRDTNSPAAECSTMLAQAQSSFTEALAVANEQQAITWKLRILGSMERLKQY